MKTRTKYLLLTAVSTVIFIFSCENSASRLHLADSSASQISEDSLITLVQLRTFRYFWDGAEPVSGLACERYHVDGVYPENDKNVITTGGSGFGIMAILSGIERGFITREEGYSRLRHAVDWLEKADRFHGA